MFSNANRLEFMPETPFYPSHHCHHYHHHYRQEYVSLTMLPAGNCSNSGVNFGVNFGVICTSSPLTSSFEFM